MNTSEEQVPRVNTTVQTTSLETETLDFLPPEIIRILKRSEHRFTQSEQVLLTLLAQIIVEIIINEEL